MRLAAEPILSYWNLGLPLIQGYGLTETHPIPSVLVPSKPEPNLALWAAHFRVSKSAWSKKTATSAAPRQWANCKCAVVT